MKLSEACRGQIEQQQAEFNALAKQTETVAIAVSLRAEAEAQSVWIALASAVPDEAGAATTGLMPWRIMELR